MRREMDHTPGRPFRSVRTVSMSLAAVLVLALVLAGCAGTDVVGRDAVRTFGAVMAMEPVEPAFGDGWQVTVEGVSFGFTSDRVFLDLPLAPFQEAGLDPGRLPEGYEADTDGGRLRVAASLDKPAGTLDPDDLAGSLSRLVGKNPDIVGYHAALGHYNVAIGELALFEWAEDPSANDKDVVIALKPAPLAEAGVDVDGIAGFLHAEVDMGMGETMKLVLMPVDLG